MQSDNAPNLTAEVSNEFLKAAHVTKVTSTAGHPRTQGLVERQNRTLLTLLRVFCSRRMRDWDQCLDEVMGAYNSTRHATTGFSPYMLTRGVEKASPLTFLYPEFAAKSFDTHEAYVDHVLARQQEIHDLVRRNTHQAQLRQKLKYDRAIRARAYQPGELVWDFCRYVPQKGSPKLMRAWRGPHKVVQVFQEGRVYVLDTGQKVHFERLKPHHSGPLELATAQADSGEIVVLMDPDPERSIDVVDDDKSQPSYKTEQPPVPGHIAFGPFNFEREPVQMARCITADLLCDKYGVYVEPGKVYSPAPHWWSLITAPRVEAIVEPLHFLSCLEGLRTLTTADLILCFHIIDWYRGKAKFSWWLELVITCFTNYPQILSASNRTTVDRSSSPQRMRTAEKL